MSEMSGFVSNSSANPGLNGSAPTQEVKLVQSGQGKVILYDLATNPELAGTNRELFRS